MIPTKEYLQSRLSFLHKLNDEEYDELRETFSDFASSMLGDYINPEV